MPGDALTAAGYSPLVTGDPRDLSRIVKTEQPQLVLLDLMLPETDGIELMERIPELADLPVIFISAYSRDETIARALEAGAADYIVKPFSTTELTARIRAALRRRAEPDPFVLGALAIRYDQRQVCVAGRPVELTATEYELLRVLSLNAGRVSGYESLLRQVSGKARNRAAMVALRGLVKTLTAQARRCRQRTRLHPYRAQCRLPHAPAGTLRVNDGPGSTRGPGRPSDRRTAAAGLRRTTRDPERLFGWQRRGDRTVQQHGT